MADNNMNTSSTVKLDGEVIINVLSDFSAAYMTLYPPKPGGKDITYEGVMNALAAKGVRHNVNTELIVKAVEEKWFDREIQVAVADKPVDGIDGTITYKFPKEQNLAPVEDENGFVDYKSLGRIRNIHTGEVIAEITLPTEGTPGTDVRGVALRAVPGRAAPYKLGEKTRLSEDETKILAAADGHVCWKGNAFCVETTVTINGDVDASVGNLDFIGDIVIKGEVLEGFTIISAKNILVYGNVTNAVIKAGGTVTVKKGSINSDITAHGDVVCQFCEHSRIRSDCAVTAQNFVLCEVYCGGDLSAKALNGGKYTCLGDTEATFIGSKNYTATEVIAGDNAVLTTERDNLRKRIDEIDSMNVRVNQILEFLAQKKQQTGSIPADKVELLKKSAATLTANREEKQELMRKISEIDSALSEKQYRNIKCKGMVYPGVKVTINDSYMKFDTETPRVSIHLDADGNIVTGPL